MRATERKPVLRCERAERQRSERPAPACVAGERNERPAWPGNAMSVWSHEIGPEHAPWSPFVHGALDRSAAMLRLSAAARSALSGPALRPAGLCPVAPRQRTVHDRVARRRSSRPPRRAACCRVWAQLRRQRGVGARRAAPGSRPGSSRLRGSAVVAAVVAGQQRSARQCDTRFSSGCGRAVHASNGR